MSVVELNRCWNKYDIIAQYAAITFNDGIKEWVGSHVEINGLPTYLRHTVVFQAMIVDKGNDMSFELFSY